ncbi:hypothetical protein Patl1_15072 [Pistacia atlantica]|uniref:Uncharacterized protein n=1 Tax=Pistacia atlantica TaxID=434234 RepID=A0ACC1B552_9ROSI|nr:hypothetical protein Patl1_15072 [Pistacia atlantica]
MQNPVNSGAKETSRVGQTLFKQTKVKRPVRVFSGNSTTGRTRIPVVSKMIKWSDVQFPEEWKFRDENPPESKEYTSPPRIEFQGGFRPAVLKDLSNAIHFGFLS